jgi:hypothetical protein
MAECQQILSLRAMRSDFALSLAFASTALTTSDRDSQLLDA